MVGVDFSPIEGFISVGCSGYCCKVRSTKQVRLAPLIVQPLAVITKPITTRAAPAFIRGYIAAWRARVVIVMDTIWGWLVGLIDGVKCGYCGHDGSPSQAIIHPEGRGF